jgi:integrase
MDDSESTPAWTTEQLGGFVDQIKDDRFAALWLLVATTGLEPQALAGLRRDEVDLHERRIFPGRRSNTADSAGRGSPPRHGRGYGLDPTTYDVLRNHVIDWDKQRETSFREARHLFLRTDGRPVRPEHVSLMFAVHCLRAGLPVVAMDQVRETYVRNALQSGIPTRVLSDRLGHDVAGPRRLRVPVQRDRRTSQGRGL